MGRQGSVGPVMVGEADDARVVFRAAPVVAEVELFEAQDLRAGLAGEPVHGGAPYAAATHDDVLERRLSSTVHARLPPRLICGASQWGRRRLSRLYCSLMWCSSYPDWATPVLVRHSRSSEDFFPSAFAI